MSLDLFKDVINKMCLLIIYISLCVRRGELNPTECMKKKVKQKKDMFGDLFIVPTCFHFKVLSEYKNILLKLFFFLYEK